MTKKLLFAGCSYTAGNGWLDVDPTESGNTEVKDSPNLWVNLCHTHIERLQTLDLVNVGRGGASNTDIFQNTIRKMAAEGNNIDTIFCQWTAMPRYNWNVGFELWDTSESLGGRRSHDINLNRGNHWPREYIVDLVDRLRVMHHLHWEILKVVDYSNIIYTLAQKLGIDHVYFINGLCPWDPNYFVELHNVKPEAYTEFTKSTILNIDTRDDTDILKLYKLAHQHYRERGGIDTANWINLYEPFNKNKVDVNFDQLHPGVNSNRLYYEMVDRRLKELNL